jgi:hypothetical protein
MTLPEIQVLVQSISSFAIAGGLVFTAVQFRHARKSQQVASFMKMVELQMHLREMRVKDPELASVFRDDMQELTNDTEVRAYFFSLMQLSVYEIVWYAHKNGVITEDYFASWARRMRVIAAEPAFRKMVKSPSMKIMHDEFQTYVNHLVDNTPGRSAQD